MSTLPSLFTYSWHIDEDEKEVTIIRVYGLNIKNESVCLIIKGFLPYVYLELPNEIEWTDSLAGMVANRLNSLLRDKKPVTYELVYKKKLYYANLDIKTDEKGNTTYKKRVYPFLKCCCSHTEDIRQLGFKIRKEIKISGIPAFSLKMHEQNADPILKLISIQKLPMTGWIQFNGKKVKKEDQVTYCTHEYEVNYKRLTEYKCDIVPKPLLMGFDIEVNSTIPSSMPKAERPGDKVFQISCVFGIQGNKPDTYEKVLLTLGDPHTDILDKEGIHVFTFDTEAELLLGFTDIIQEKQPNICIGYNIFGFDIDYMLKRARLLFCMYDFDKQGMLKNAHGREKSINWTSSAYKNQSFQFLDVEGRIFVDLLPLVKRDHKMNNYKLKTIAAHFLKGITKDPLTHKDIFDAYVKGMTGSEEGKKALQECGKYCTIDSDLVVRLFEVLTIWFALCEMSKITSVDIFSLFTRGQQLRIFSQTYKKCTNENIVVEKDAYIAGENDHYLGAYVKNPVPGIYDMVAPLDFCLTGDTLISTDNGYSIRLDEYKNEKVIGWDGNSYRIHDTQGVVCKGEKETVKVFLQDGTFITCTPDHKFMLDDGSWCEAKNLKNKYVKCGMAQPEDKRSTEEKDWELHTETMVFHMKTEEAREKSLAFARILGYVLSDGSVYESGNAKCCEAYMGTKMDAIDFMKDVFKICGKARVIRKRCGPGVRGIKGTTYCLTLPVEISKAIHSLDNIVIGKRATQAMTLPLFLQEETCPLSIIREFLAGLFGGDATAPHHAKKCTSHFGRISFKWTTVETYKDNMLNTFLFLQELLWKFDIDTSICEGKVRYFEKCIKPKDYLKNSRWDYNLSIYSKYMYLFLEKIGFRYCINKTAKLTIAYSYQKMQNKTREQCDKITTRVIELKEQGITTRDALNISRKEIFKNEPPINTYSLSSVEYVNYMRNENKRHADRPKRLSLQNKLFPSPLEYITETDTLSWFKTEDKKMYAVSGDSNIIPSYRKKVLDIFPDKKQPVYDLLEVESVKNFLAGGIVTHNCSMYPSTVIAYNISWDTFVIDDKIPDNLCHVMEWDEHVGCQHDPKEIRKAELNAIIKEKDLEVKELRRQRDLKINKDLKAEFKIQIADLVKSIKPFRDERSQLQKGKPKYITCTPRKFRWLKEPRGKLPEILADVLDSRVNTRKILKQEKILLSELKKDTPEYDSKLVYCSILDQRQLAQKLVSNSGYGCLGVRRGFLPLMPGAMCTTYMCREAIQKTADIITNKYGGNLIYSDTDSDYLNFPGLKTTQECWDYAIKVAKEVSDLFPKPLSIAFEDKIYTRILFLTKKRYMSTTSDREGKTDGKISKKGVLLNRRDNSPFVRKVYEGVVMMIFNKENKEKIVDYILDELNNLCSASYSIENFIITKSVGDIEDLDRIEDGNNGIPCPGVDPKTNKPCHKIGDYKVKLLPTDKKKREAKMKDKEATTLREYYLRCLPAQAQLADKMRNRGQLVAAGSRIEYVITTEKGHTANQYEKIECAEYFSRHSRVLNIDYLYYLKQLANPLDQVLNIMYDKEGVEGRLKDFVLSQYKYRAKIRGKVLEELRSLTKPKIVFKDK